MKPRWPRTSAPSTTSTASRSGWPLAQDRELRALTPSCAIVPAEAPPEAPAKCVPVEKSQEQASSGSQDLDRAALRVIRLIRVEQACPGERTRKLVRYELLQD